MKARASAFKASIPVFFGYLPLGMAFGLLFDKLGYPWLYAPLSGLVVFAGAAQFLSVGLLGAHANLGSIFVAVFSLNLRHMFYGFSLFHRFPNDRLKPYLIFGLTDETYSVLTATHLEDKEEDERFCFWLTFFNHGYWIAGCALGALLGRGLPIDTTGLDFALTALFVVLTLEQALAVKRVFPFAAALAAGALSLWLFPRQMLLGSISLVFATLLVLSLRKGAPDGR